MIRRSIRQFEMKMRSRREEQSNESDDIQESSNNSRDLPPEATGGINPGDRSMPVMPEPDDCIEPLKTYYIENPDVYELDKLRLESIMPKRSQDTAKYGDYYTLINAWASAWSTHESITSPPEISDFQFAGPGGRGRPIRDPIPFKSPDHASRLIKKVAHHFGATLVGITKLNPDWCYNFGLRGSDEEETYKVPEHWENVIAFGIPHQWEQVESNPNMGTSYDAYARSSIAARRLETFIKSLGYPARRHSPMDGYDLIAVPVLVEAGLGQQGRHGIVVTPETGSNLRVAFVTTNLPMTLDKPIDFGVNEFCATCKICAEICPSNSISYEESNEDMNRRGYNHWEINTTSCYNYWMQSMGSMGCRLCLIACPYSRKNNWVHAMARNTDRRDPTGLLTDGLVKMQKSFFKSPEASEYLPPPDGRFANFREPPDWLTVKDYLDMDVLDPTIGE